MVLGVDTRFVAVGIVGLGFVAGAVVMSVVDRERSLAVGTDLDRAARVVGVGVAVRVIVQGHVGRIVGMAAEAWTGIHHRNVTAVAHRDRSSSSSRRLDRWRRWTVCLGKDSRRVVVRKLEGRTWRWIDCRCWTVSPRACDRSSVRQRRVLRADRVVCLRELVPWHSWKNGRLTMLAHSLAIRPCKFRSQFANALVQLLYLRFP